MSRLRKPDDEVAVSPRGWAPVTSDDFVDLDTPVFFEPSAGSSESGNTLVNTRRYTQEVEVGPESGNKVAGIVPDLHALAGSAEDIRMSNFDRGTLSQYSALVRRACEVFGDDARASLWLSTPSIDLGGRVPLEIAAADGYSLTRFEPLFARIEHGIDF